MSRSAGVQVARAREMLPSKVHVLEVPYETPYIRDTSPLVSCPRAGQAAEQLHILCIYHRGLGSDQPVSDCKLFYVIMR